jgi:hypothetical protein
MEGTVWQNEPGLFSELIRIIQLFSPSSQEIEEGLIFLRYRTILLTAKEPANKVAP